MRQQNLQTPTCIDESQPVWTTKDGQEIPVSGMTTSHIINAGRMVYAKYQSLAIDLTEFYSCAPPSADAAELSWEMAEAAGLEEVRACLYWLYAFAEELERRGLKTTYQLPQKREATP